MSEQQIKCVLEALSLKINDMALKCADDPEATVPDISLTPSGLGIRAIAGSQECLNWLVKFAEYRGQWAHCGLLSPGELARPPN